MTLKILIKLMSHLTLPTFFLISTLQTPNPAILTNFGPFIEILRLRTSNTFVVYVQI